MDVSKIYENKMVDTMIFIDLCKNNCDFPICFCELSIYEMLKNKDSNERKRQFKNIDNFVKRTNSIPFLSIQNNIFDYRDDNIRYDETIELCKKCSLTIASFSLNFVAFIVELLFIKKYCSILNDKNKNFFEQICYTIEETKRRICNENKNELIDAFFNNKKFVLNDFIISMINIYIKKINKFYNGNDSFHLEEIDALNTNAICVKNNVKFLKNDIEWFIDNIVEVKHNVKITKEFFKAYLERLLLESGTFEVNDIVDMNIAFSAISNRIEFISNDKSIYRTILNKINF